MPGKRSGSAAPPAGHRPVLPPDERQQPMHAAASVLHTALVKQEQGGGSPTWTAPPLVPQLCRHISLPKWMRLFRPFRCMLASISANAELRAPQAGQRLAAEAWPACPPVMEASAPRSALQYRVEGKDVARESSAAPRTTAGTGRPTPALAAGKRAAAAAAAIVKQHRQADGAVAMRATHIG